MMRNDSTNRAVVGLAAHFGNAPRWIASAPGRVNLIGEFTDFNGGFVLPMAIGRRTSIAAAPNGSDRIVLRTEVSRQTVELDSKDILEPDPGGSWGNYPIGVIAGFRQLNLTPPGFNAYITSDVPIGAGLSSSAALEAATATLLEGICDAAFDPVRKALLCQAAEHAFPRVPCGIMDQFISILGRENHLLLLNCSSNEPTWISFYDPAVAILVVNTHVKHQLSGSEYGDRRRSCETAARALDTTLLCHVGVEALELLESQLEDRVVQCARHVLTENERTLDAAQCVRVGDWERLGLLMYASHESLRRDYQVSCAELDAVVESAHAIGIPGGVYGCRMTGGGFGGCAVVLIRASQEREIADGVTREYRRVTGKVATVFSSRPSSGASLTVVE